MRSYHYLYVIGTLDTIEGPRYCLVLSLPVYNTVETLDTIEGPQ